MSIRGMLHGLTGLSFKHTTTRSDSGPLCINASHNHHVYLPFFCDNGALLMAYGQLLQVEGEPHKDFTETQLSELRKYMNMEEVGYLLRECFYTGGKPNKKGAGLSENVWSRRLVNRMGWEPLILLKHGFLHFWTTFDSPETNYKHFFPGVLVMLFSLMFPW